MMTSSPSCTSNQRPLEQFERIFLHDLATSLAEIGRLKLTEFGGAPDRWTEACRRANYLECVAQDGFTLRRVIIFWIEQADIVSLSQILNWQASGGEQFVQIPDAPGILAGWLGLDVQRDAFRIDNRKKLGEDQQVDTVIFECKLKLRAEIVGRRIDGREQFLDLAVGRFRLRRGAGGDAGLMPMRDHREIVLLDKFRVSHRFQSIRRYFELKTITAVYF